MTTNNAAALELIEKAYNAKEQSTVTLLLGAAKRLDSTIDTKAIEQQWFNKWLADQQEKRNTK